MEKVSIVQAIVIDNDVKSLALYGSTEDILLGLSEIVRGVMLECKEGDEKKLARGMKGIVDLAYDFVMIEKGKNNAD